ncbi:uncharacterized protein LOC134278025 [Saccostrea cucullata]|uniref:uncharacterized protein LOC134278025 n=1 Tax=Saccostrea cuccullata TaxID=36930 RepID=UPI002ED1A966
MDVFHLTTPNKRLEGHVIEKLLPVGMQMCMKECSVRTLCKSLNFCRNQLTCELSSSNAEMHSDDLIDDSEFLYAEKTDLPRRYSQECNKTCFFGSKCINLSSGPVCQISDCPATHPDSNTTSVQVTSTRVGTVLRYNCTEWPQISLTSTCLPNGTWSSESNKCIINLPDCFNSEISCWFKFNFTYSSYCDYCKGTQYVKKTNYTSAPYVGIILNTSQTPAYRYKILLGSNLSGTFYDVAEDKYYLDSTLKKHCDLVGGSQDKTPSSADHHFKIGNKIFYRTSFDDDFTFDYVREENRYYTKCYYECRVVLPFLYEPDCYSTTKSCWYRYDFASDDTWNGCPSGERYIKKTNLSSAPIVGIVKCSHERYQLYLGASRTDLFLNVGDSDGTGEKLCELVGGLGTNVVTANDYDSAPTMKGYCLSELEQEFNISSIGRNTGCRSNSWYECGVSLPAGWYRYNISYIAAPNYGMNVYSCSGDTYVRNTTTNSLPFVAAVVCKGYENMRYKLYGGSNLTDSFTEIYRHTDCGNDCDLVYGYPYDEVQNCPSSTFTTSCTSINDCSSVPGYYRYNGSGEFSYGCFNASLYRWYYYKEYMECGIQVP